MARRLTNDSRRRAVGENTKGPGRDNVRCGLTLSGRVAVHHQVLARLHQRLRQVGAEHVVLGPVPDDVAEHGVKEVGGVHGERLDLEQGRELREHRYERLHEEPAAAGAEQLLDVVAEHLRVAVVLDGVQLQAERARADHVVGEVADDPLDLDRRAAVAVARLQAPHQPVAALLDLVVHALQLAGREPRAELLPHGPPPLVRGEEHALGQQVHRRVEVQPAVREVREVLDHDPVDQLRVADHQERRAELVEAAVPRAREPPVRAVERLQLVFQAHRHPVRVAEQRHGRRVRHVQPAPLAVRGRREVIRGSARGRRQAQGGRVAQPTDQRPDHGVNEIVRDDAMSAGH